MSLKIRMSRGGAKKRPFYRIVVADNEFYLRFFNFALDFVYMEEAFPPSSVLRNLTWRQMG